MRYTIEACMKAPLEADPNASEEDLSSMQIALLWALRSMSSKEISKVVNKHVAVVESRIENLLRYGLTREALREQFLDPGDTTTVQLVLAACVMNGTMSWDQKTGAYSLTAQGVGKVEGMIRDLQRPEDLKPRSDLVTCPWCGEDDFDRIGLRMHVERGWCEGYEKAGKDHAAEINAAAGRDK